MSIPEMIGAAYKRNRDPKLDCYGKLHLKIIGNLSSTLFQHQQSYIIHNLTLDIIRLSN